MMRLVELLAPRTWADVVLKVLASLVLIIAMTFVVMTQVVGRRFDLVEDLFVTTLVALPFVVLAAVMLMHQRRLQHQLTRLATTDVLTGLPNRRAFLAFTAEAMEDGREGALLILDADHFKRINDTFGHAAGDACLVAIGAHLRRCLRPDDVVGRLGGEEFAIFMPGAAPEEARAAGDRLCGGVAVKPAEAEATLRVTLSIGATLGRAPAPLARLMAEADAALYRAKAEGLARMVFWSEDLAAQRDAEEAAVETAGRAA